MSVTDDTLTFENQLRAALADISDAQVRDLVAAWAITWDEVEPDLRAVLLDELTAGDKVTRAQMLRSLRLAKVLAVIADRLDDLATVSQVRIIRDVRNVIDTAGAAQASIIDSQLPPGTNLVALDAWSQIEARQIDAIVERVTKQITALHKPLSSEAYQAVRRELVRSVAAGSNPRAAAGRMIARARSGFNGGLNRALVIARTEILDAHRTAAQRGQAEHADVLAGWVWLAKLDSRTCPSCWAQHGGLHDLDEAGPLDHHQGRCARMPQAKPWRELGIELDEPAPVTPDAGAVFASLSPQAQREVLGPVRYQAWVEGRYPMGTWSERRRTEGWRDSFHVAPAPRGQRVGRSSSAA